MDQQSKAWNATGSVEDVSQVQLALQLSRNLGRNWDKRLKSFPPCYSVTSINEFYTPSPPPFEKKWFETRARMFKLLRSCRIDYKKPIPPGCVAWRAGTTTLFVLGS